MAVGKSPTVRAVAAVLVIVLAAVWLVYYFILSKKPMEGRTHDEKEYLYKCWTGHIFNAYGRKAPRPCETEGCDKDAYLYLVFACPGGDRINVLLRPGPDRFRFEDYSPDDDWDPFEVDEFVNRPCPACHNPGLMPATETPG